MALPVRGSALPITPKLIWTLFVPFQVPVYTWWYGLPNFLWFSNLALFLSGYALWRENRLAASMMSLSVLLPEALWNFEFFGRLIAKRKILGLAGYMFDEQIPAWIRGISLYHVGLPPLLLWMVHRMGYDRRALRAQCLFGWSVLLLTYLITRPEENINWVYGPGDEPQETLPRPVYLLLVGAFFPLCLYWPTHKMLARWRG
jgi:hypothetical protein